MNSKKRIKSILGFKLLQALNDSDLEKLKDLLQQYGKKEQDNFDSVTQNLLILEYLFTKNMYLFITEQEKQGIHISDLIKQVKGNKQDATFLNALYILCNHVFMKNINARSPSFSSDVFKGFILDFENVAFVNKKFNKLPSFPYFKLFLQHISHNFQI